MTSDLRRDPAAGPTWPWVVLLVLPLAGLVLLLAQPELDVHWEHHPSHFWLVLGTAAVSVVLAYVTNVVAARYRDARVVLVSLAFLSSAGFLGLHALATPGVLLADQNVGFVIATPIGLLLSAVFAAISISSLAGPNASFVLRRRSLLVGAVIALMAVWAFLSLAGLPPLDGPPPAKEALGPLTLLGVVSVIVYLLAAWRAFQLQRLRGGLVLLTIAIAFVLLAEAMIALTLSRNWRLSWWEWHIVMLLAFAAIALGARSEYQRSGSLSATFGGLYLDATLARIDRWHAGAIAAVASADERGIPAERIVADLRREGATDDDVRLLSEAARELRRLDSLFRPYLPSVVAQRIRADPAADRLGGVERDVTVLFADLAGFTTFSETRRPTEVIAMLNEFWAAIVPVIDAGGGVIEHFAGDGILAVFNAAGEQPDHAARAARTGLAILATARPLSTGHRGWPTFRIGINSGRAVVGTVGAEGRRSFATIGDTTNTAARVMAAGKPGEIVLAGATRDLLGDAVIVSSLGPTAVKGKRLPVEAWVLLGLAESIHPERVRAGAGNAGASGNAGGAAEVGHAGEAGHAGASGSDG
jgi:class 3 adenylate cyclase